jgi:hypothetical protein
MIIAIIFNVIQTKQGDSENLDNVLDYKHSNIFVFEIAPIYADIDAYFLGAYSLYFSMFLSGSYSSIKIIGN